MSPTTVPSAMITPSGAPTLRIRLGSGGMNGRGCWGCGGTSGCDTRAG